LREKQWQESGDSVRGAWLVWVLPERNEVLGAISSGQLHAGIVLLRVKAVADAPLETVAAKMLFDGDDLVEVDPLVVGADCGPSSIGLIDSHCKFYEVHGDGLPKIVDPVKVGAVTGMFFGFGRPVRYFRLLGSVRGW